MIKFKPLLIVILLGLIGGIGGGYISSNVNLSLSESDASEGLLRNTVSCAPSAPEVLGKRPSSSATSRTVSSLGNTNRSLERAYDEYKQSPSTSKSNEVGNLLRQRKTQLVEAMRNDPNAALTMILPAEERESLGASSRGCVEQLAKVKGRIESAIADNFDEGYVDTRHTLVTSRGAKINIHASVEDALSAGDTVEVQGYKVDGEILVDTSTTISSGGSGLSRLSKSAEAPILGEQRVALIMANLPGFPLDVGEDHIRDIYQSTGDFVAENSYDKANVTFDIYGPYSVEAEHICANFAAFIEAADDGIYYPDYDYITIAGPFSNYGCGFAGVGTLGKIDFETDDGNITVGANQNTVRSDYSDDTMFRIFTHELGHNLGNHHSGSYECTDGAMENQTFYTEANKEHRHIQEALDLGIISAFEPQECVRIEYGNNFDIMGYGRGHFSTPHKENMGWLDTTDIRIIDRSGTYSVKPHESLGDGAELLKIQRGPREAQDNHIYIEYRQPIGVDAIFGEEYPGTDIYDGASVFLKNDDIAKRGRLKIFDRSPSRPDAIRVTFVPGDNFYDPASRIDVSVLSADENELVVDVDIPSDLDLANQVGFIVEPEDGSEHSGVISLLVEPQNSVSVDRVEFYVKYFPFRDVAVSHIGTAHSAPYSIEWDPSWLEESEIAPVVRFYSVLYDSNRHVSVDSAVITIVPPPTPTPTPPITPTPTPLPTVSCGSDGLCTRAEMAQTLVDAIEFKLPGADKELFSDVPYYHPNYDAIQIIAANGITSGCAANRFCPDIVITRGQWAVFLSRARGFEVSACTEKPFSDVATSHSFCKYIKELKERGITSGCRTNEYCIKAQLVDYQAEVMLQRGDGR